MFLHAIPVCNLLCNLLLSLIIRPNKKIGVVQVTGLKILGREGPFIFL